MKRYYRKQWLILIDAVIVTIHNPVKKMHQTYTETSELLNRIRALEEENAETRNFLEFLMAKMSEVDTLNSYIAERYAERETKGKLQQRVWA